MQRLRRSRCTTTKADRTRSCHSRRATGFSSKANFQQTGGRALWRMDSQMRPSTYPINISHCAPRNATTLRTRRRTLYSSQCPQLRITLLIACRCQWTTRSRSDRRQLAALLNTRASISRAAFLAPVKCYGTLCSLTTWHHPSWRTTRRVSVSCSKAKRVTYWTMKTVFLLSARPSLWYSTIILKTYSSKTIIRLWTSLAWAVIRFRTTRIHLIVTSRWNSPRKYNVACLWKSRETCQPVVL